MLGQTFVGLQTVLKKMFKAAALNLVLWVISDSGRERSWAIFELGSKFLAQFVL